MARGRKDMPMKHDDILEGKAIIVTVAVYIGSHEHAVNVF